MESFYGFSVFVEHYALNVNFVFAFPNKRLNSTDVLGQVLGRQFGNQMSFK